MSLRSQACRLTIGHIQQLPELYARLTPMPYAAVVQMQKDLRGGFALAGYTVTGGH